MQQTGRPIPAAPAGPRPLSVWVSLAAVLVAIYLPQVLLLPEKELGWYWPLSPVLLVILFFHDGNHAKTWLLGFILMAMAIGMLTVLAQESRRIRFVAALFVAAVSSLLAALLRAWAPNL